MGFQTGVFKFEGLQFLHVMVFFICNGCGASLKKNNVEKHQTHQCRKSGHLSCMDCSKDFFGEDYKGHVKCISEEEKYSAKGWSAKPNQNKNERKQTEWVAMVQELPVRSTKVTLHFPASFRLSVNMRIFHERKPSF